MLCSKELVLSKYSVIQHIKLFKNRLKSFWEIKKKKKKG